MDRLSQPYVMSPDKLYTQMKSISGAYTFITNGNIGP
jgi:hypothetical protein